ncbi:MAG: hypothetical protein LBE38_01845 [Deltaproteobacteria bacterium]|jgi:hypothetical protein|nr:hypothetical protein [Deltaproteobacteria bacterium]
MKNFSELYLRLLGLVTRLDGDLWDSIIKELNPPKQYPKDAAIQDLAFRDSKALAGYVPDLRKIMRDTSPTSLAPEEFKAFASIFSLFNLSARLPVLLLSIGDYKETESLIDVYNGYRQLMVELNNYLSLAEEAISQNNPKDQG